MSEQTFQYLPIPLERLDPGKNLDFDIFIFDPQLKKQVLYLSRHHAFEQKHRDLCDRKSSRLYIRSADNASYLQYVQRQLKERLADPRLPKKEKMKLFYTESKQMMADILANPAGRDLGPEAAFLVEQSAQVLFSERAPFTDILHTMSFEYEVYSHSLNVSILAMAFASHLGKQPSEVKTIGCGALLHDIGKSQIPREVLLKPGKLNDGEWRVMMSHSEAGYQILNEQGGVPDTVLRIVRHHHEKFNGAGYPGGLAGSNIPEYVQIVTHADVYDALTSKRCYKDAANTYNALETMMAEMTGTFREDLLYEFIGMFEKGVAA